MRGLLLKIQRAHAQMSDKAFIHRHSLDALLSNRKGLRILFSNEVSRKELFQLGFNNTRHHISFEEFTPANIAAHDVVVPLTVHELLLLNNIRPLIANNVIPIPTVDVINLCNDKLLLNEALIKHGFERYVPSMHVHDVYPHMYKKRIDTLSMHSFLVEDANAQEALYERYPREEFFSQAFVKGSSEYATHILIKNKEILHSITIRFYFDSAYEVKGKDEVQFTRIVDCEYLDIFEKMLVAIKFEGLCCINYKIYKNQLFVFEINPRVGASSVLLFFTFFQHLGLPEEKEKLWWQKESI